MGRVGGLSFTGLAAFTERIGDPQEYETEHEVEWAVGAILLVDATCYCSLGGMDESYFLYSEETDLSLRAKDADLARLWINIALLAALLAEDDLPALDPEAPDSLPLAA